MSKYLFDKSKIFFLISKFELFQNVDDPNSLTIVTSKRLVGMRNYPLILSIFSYNENQEFTV